MKKIVTFLLIFVSAFTLFAYPVLAAPSGRSGERVLLAKDEIVNHDYFSAGNYVTVSGIVNGDAYVAGETVIVDGTVNGDLLVAGRKVDIRGIIKGDVRVVGKSVTVSGNIAGNLTIGGSDVELTNTASIAGSVVAGASQMAVAAPIGKDLTAGVGKLTVESKVKGDVNYWSDADVTMGPDATVSGRVERRALPEQKSKPSPGSMVAPFAGFKLINMIGLFILGLILLRLAPVYAKETVARIHARPWFALFIGFCAVIMVPVTILVLMMTVIGFPLAMVGVFAFILLCTFAKVFAALAIGTYILARMSKKENDFGALTLGIVVSLFLMMIPVVGWIVLTIIFLKSLGGLILQHREFYLTLRAKKLV